jgi:hypothetical protein
MGMVRSLRPRCSVRQADVLMFASDRTQSLFRELRLGIGLRVTFAVPGGPGAQVFRCPKRSSHASWPGSSVRTPLTGWRKPPSMLGIVTSLAHPGGNITGSTFFVSESRSNGITTRRSACRVKFLPNHRSTMTRRVGVGAGICVFQISSCSSRAREP